MPKVYKNNKKFINPRYFLDETTVREQDTEHVSESFHVDDLSCAPCGDMPPQSNQKKTNLPNAHQGEEGRMYRTQLAQMISDATMLLDMFDDTTNLPEWLEVKITKASDYITSATRYLSGEISREQGRLE